MRLPLTALLLRGGVTPVSALTESSRESVDLMLWSDGTIERINLDEAELATAARAGELVIALFDRSTDPPAWQEFLNQAFAVPFFTGPSASRGAVIFCPVDTPASRRWIAWCFGSGSKALRRAASDSRFGLMVALNALAGVAEFSGPAEGPVQGTSRPHLRDVATSTTLGTRQRSSHRAARSIPANAFRVDRHSDLVRSIGGSSDDPLLGVVSGGRSLTFRKNIELIDEFVELSSEILERGINEGYKAAFGWVDRITLIDDEQLHDALIEQLVNDLITESAPDADVMLPDDLIDADNENAIEFILLPGERRMSACRKNFTLPMVVEQLRRSADPGERAHRLAQALRFLDENKREVGTASTLECLAADITHDNSRYVLHEGDFYRIDDSFIDEVNDELRDLCESALSLPCYHGESEPQYNKTVATANPRRFILLDGQLFRVPGETGIELCDLLSDTGVLVHVKRKGRSSVLSHLFLQAANSCDLLRRSALAREQLTAMVQASPTSPSFLEATLAVLEALERRGSGPEVVFTFLGDFRSNRIVDLPLFSKVSLVQVVRTLGFLGYRTTYKLVGNCLTGHPALERSWS